MFQQRLIDVNYIQYMYMYEEKWFLVHNQILVSHFSYYACWQQ